jgi:RNA polymerase sigma-70 factor (ECF subfamily)
MNEEITNKAIELMQKAVAGDSEAFGELYRLYFSPIYRYIFFRVRNTAIAEDITQAVFLKVFSKLSGYQDRKHPPLAYFFTVARNKVIDYWRQNSRVELLDDNNDLSKIADTSDTAEDIFSRTIALEQLSRALEKIPKEQRDAIILKFINELSYAEIAAMLKKKETAIRQLISRGVKNLRKHIQ